MRFSEAARSCFELELAILARCTKTEFDGVKGGGKKTGFVNGK